MKFETRLRFNCFRSSKLTLPSFFKDIILSQWRNHNHNRNFLSILSFFPIRNTIIQFFHCCAAIIAKDIKKERKKTWKLAIKIYIWTSLNDIFFVPFSMFSFSCDFLFAFVVKLFPKELTLKWTSNRKRIFAIKKFSFFV